ncbi:MAG: hypothetical protein ACJAT5_000304 [Lentimonas sp.]|jgi:hypothetical protein
MKTTKSEKNYPSDITREQFEPIRGILEADKATNRGFIGSLQWCSLRFKRRL